MRAMPEKLAAAEGGCLLGFGSVGLRLGLGLGLSLGSLGLGGRRGVVDLLLVALAEAVDTASRVDELLRARVEGGAGRTDVDLEGPPGGAGDEGVAAGARDASRGVVGVEAFLHGGGGNIVPGPLARKIRRECRRRHRLPQR